MGAIELGVTPLVELPWGVVAVLVVVELLAVFVVGVEALAVFVVGLLG